MFVPEMKPGPAYVRVLINYARHRLARRHCDFVASTCFGSRVAGNTADNLSRKLFFFGIWEPNLTHWMCGQLRPGDTFVDVGANLGYYSLLASKIVGDTGNVIAIEASPRNAAQLERNLALNRTRNVRAVQAAVTDRVGTVSFYQGPAGRPGQSSVAKRKGMAYECEVPTAPLCEILTPHETATARIIKIDVEGAECAAVAGLLPCLTATSPELEIVLEINPAHLASEGHKAEDLIAAFTDAGLHAYRIENDYANRSYLPPLDLKRPVRQRGPVTRLSDVIFSRRDQPVL